MSGKVKAIIPPKFQSEAVMKTLRSEMEKYAPFIKKDFERLVQPWEGDKPKFVPVLKVKSSQIVIEIRVTGSKLAKNKFMWLNLGTKPHIIKAKRAKYLRFQTGYQPGSKPNQTFTSKPKQADGAFVQKKQVHHPGFPARNWSKLLVDAHQKPFERWMEAAMRAAAKASGHGAK